MKALVSGIVHRKGNAKKTGNPYDFTRLLTLNPVQPIDSENMTVRGAGLQQAEVNAEPALVQVLQGLKLPAHLELLTEARPNAYGELELVVTGVKS